MTDERPKAPIIEPLEYLTGVKVVDIGDLRVARGKSRRPFSVCKHNQLVYDQSERRIWCKECECDVEGYDAFVLLVEQYHAAHADLIKRDQKISDAETHSLFSRAAKTIDHSWRKKNLSPCCPHCSGVLLPEDFADGIRTSRNTEMERMRRSKTQSK